MVKRLSAAILFVVFSVNAFAQKYTVAGVLAGVDNTPIEFATVLIKESGLWAMTNEKGEFSIKNVPACKTVLVVRCLGYVSKTLQVNVENAGGLRIQLADDNLKLNEVEVVAQRKNDAATTSYIIDRHALDNQQIMNVGDISSLLPGGKTVNSSLMNDDRLSLRSGNTEKGNASFGTAVEVDGVRLDNNAMAGETSGVSTRNVNSSNIESIEVVTGIPSVEYGDLSNGVVKVNSRKGKSPFIVEGKINPHSRLLSVNKGFDLGNNAGVMNASIEHARSFSDIASPYTAYQRNTFSLHYMNVFMSGSMPLTLNIGLSGTVGGYNSEADPDEDLDSYSRIRDNNIRGNVELNWLLNKSWVTNLNLKGSISYTDRLQTDYTNASSASTQPYIHTLTEGYYMAEDYDAGSSANIILGPTGYWYVKSYVDSKPLSASLKLKYDLTKRFGSVLSKLMAGSEYTRSENLGRGSYYDDMQYAPTWREYRYDAQPAMNNLAVYGEEKVTVPVMRHSSLELTAGMRDDITMIGGSDYGTVSSISPRFNGKLTLWNNSSHWVRSLAFHAGWGKSVKLPSFQVLYPSPSYSDKLAFSSTSTADNKSYYAYYTYPSTALYNSDLKWQYTNQTDLGVELNLLGAKITVSGFHNRTYNSYMATKVYTPFTYNYTSPTAVQNCGIDVTDRTFSIDSQTGVVTVHDASGLKSDVTLGYKEMNTYVSNTKYVNASPIDRYGLEWIIDFPRITPLNTNIRLDGNYYYYKGVDNTLIADIPLGVTSTMSDGSLYQYVGYYQGSSATSTGYSAGASVANGAVAKSLNINTTVTTHIPKVRMIIALRVEASLYTYRRSLCLGNAEETGVVYPMYYSTWDNPETLIPFAAKYEWAKENDATLYSDLTKLVVRNNYDYTLNANRISAYYSANLSVTKEIGDHVSVSFYANNFFNTLKKIHSSQTDTSSSLFASSYVPSFYYGLSLKLKL